MRQPPLKNQNGMVLVTALMFMVILFILGTTAYLITSNDLKISGNYKTSKQAFYVAEAGIERAIAVLKNSDDFGAILQGADDDPDETADNGVLSFGSSVSFADGTYSVRISDNADEPTGEVDDPFTDVDKKVYVTSIGTKDGAASTITVLFWGNHVPVGVDGAVAIYGPNPGFDVGSGPGGPAYVSGFDYDVPDDFTCSGSNCDGTLISGAPAVPGLYVEVAEAAMDPASDFATEDDNTTAPPTSQSVFGTPPATFNTDESDSLSQWLTVVETSVPDITLNSSSTIASNTAFGSREDPVVLLVEGDFNHASGTIDGAGILIVEGDFTISGTLHWEGIIIVSSDANLEVEATGNFILLGALVVAPTSGASAMVELNGNTEIVYSSKAINTTSETFKNSRIISWENQYN